jgi:hypothetical protein
VSAEPTIRGLGSRIGHALAGERIPWRALTRAPSRTRTLALAAATLIGLAVGPRTAPAQGNTGETLRQAIRLYEDLQVERALAMFRDVISPSTPFVVSTEQRVMAYKYLGAAHATLGKPDSASVYFRAAIERDPFVDLDGQQFTAREREEFANAKQRTFAVAIRPISRIRIDPRTEHVSFEVLSTHGAMLQVEVRNAAGETSVIFASENDGVRDVPWNGLLASGRLAPPGTYQLVLRGDSRLIPSRSDSARIFFTVEHDRPPLDDTLPDLGSAGLLPERYRPSAATLELAKGLGIGVAAIAIPTLLGKGSFAGPSRGIAAAVSATGITVGILGFRWRREHGDLTSNIAENSHRRATRASRNAEIERQNEAKLANTALIVGPAAGVGP